MAATTEQASSTTGLSQSPLTTGALLQTLLGLLLVLGLIALLAWTLKRTHRFNSAVNNQMHIVGSLPLGQRERAVLLQIGTQQILVGVTAQTIQTLHVLDSPLEPTTPEINSSFSARLQDMIKQRES